jgi:hypothetical protein
VQGAGETLYGRLVKVPNGAMPLGKVQGIPEGDEYVIIKELMILSYA